MRGITTERIEGGLDAAAAALLGAATAFALLRLGADAGYAATGATVVFAWILYGLRSVEPEASTFALAQFTPVPLEPVELPELELTEADRFQPAAAEAELVLDDILAEIGPDSRVVRLFDPAAMPTPGQLKARIDRHLQGNETAPPDASQALYDALAELRRSLR